MQPHRQTPRRILRYAPFALILPLLGAGSAFARPAANGVSIWFLRGEQLARVSRPGTTPADAVRQLLAGPTAAEVKLGYRTYVPAGTRVTDVSVADGVATVDLNGRFISGGDGGNRLARLAQLVRTLTGPNGATSVQLLIGGKPVDGVFPGVPTARPVRFQFLETPNVVVTKPPVERLPVPSARVKAAQKRLIGLGYLLRGEIGRASCRERVFRVV